MDVTAQAGERQVHGQPIEMTSFVGRRREGAEVKRFLAKSRLVTLTGPGGVGKSRLAARVAVELRRAFPDGVWFVELTDVGSPEFLVQAVNDALGIRTTSSLPLLDVVTDHLRDRHLLLVLDNCEHLVAECALLTGTLLRSCPDIRILATSRQLLGVAGEHVMAVPPLHIPEADRPPYPLEYAVQNEAVQLFAERARAVVPDFAVTDVNREAVEQLCQRLDGIPLAIELAAVRLRILSVQEMLDRLDDRFRLLTVGARTAVPRHRTLHALIDWSFALCTDEEASLWTRASVFSGSLDLEAAESVCSGNGIARDDVLSLISGLVDKSILTREEHPFGVRYRLLETIRRFGLERLAEAGEEATLRRCHRDYYERLSRRVRTDMFGADELAWSAYLKVEHANLRSCLEYCFADPSSSRTGLKIAADLLYHWISGYYLTEGRRWLEQGLAMDTDPSEVRARALWSDSWLAIIQADISSAKAMLEETEAIGRRLGQASILAYAALFRGMIAMYEGDADSAIALYEKAAVRHRSVGDPIGLALTLIRLSLAYCFQSDYRRAISVANEGIAVCDAYGDGWARAYLVMALGMSIWHQGDTRRAADLEKASLRFNRALDDPLGIGLNIEVLACIAAEEHRFERAAELLGVLETLWRAVGSPLSGFRQLKREHDACESRTRQDLREPVFAAAVRRGASLSYDEALAHTLEEHALEKTPRKGERSPLTEREMEVAQLIAKGMSNKGIAASLTIAQRTAEGHVEHILSKLGFNSRAQIAVWATQHADAASGDDAPQK